MIVMLVAFLSLCSAKGFSAPEYDDAPEELPKLDFMLMRRLNVMRHSANTTLPLVLGEVHKGVEKNRPVVVWLHGLGEIDVEDSQLVRWFQWLAWQDRLCTFVIPSAPIRKVSLYGNRSMSGWYAIPATGPRSMQRSEGMVQSINYLTFIVDQLMGLKRPVILAGFSQGGTIAILTAFTRQKQPVWGAFGASSYILPFRPSQALRHTQLRMVHHNDDFGVPLSFARASFYALKRAGVNPAEFTSFPSGGHDLCDNSREALMDFIVKAWESN